MRQAELYFKRLVKAVGSGNPLSVAILNYHTTRESPLFYKYKTLKNKKKMEDIVNKSISDMASILVEKEWEKEKIEEFLKYNKEFVKDI